MRRTDYWQYLKENGWMGILFIGGITCPALWFGNYGAAITVTIGLVITQAILYQYLWKPHKLRMIANDKSHKQFLDNLNEGKERPATPEELKLLHNLVEQAREKTNWEQATEDTLTEFCDTLRQTIIDYYAECHYRVEFEADGSRVIIIRSAGPDGCKMVATLEF